MTFKRDEIQDKESQDKESQPKELKEGIQTVVANLLEPKISVDETKEYERYSPQRNTLTWVDISHTQER